MGFVVDKAALRQALSVYFGFSCQAFHQLSTLIIIIIIHHHPGLVQ
jgi:hypothetical protein